MISVIIPTYNRAYLLGRAIDSVLAQERLPDELIIVDDGSTDATRELVDKKNGQPDVAIKYVYQNNLGAAAARNTGINKSCGDLLCFLDSDDWWDKKKIRLQAALLENNRPILISHTHEMWFRRGRRVNQKKKHEPGNGFIFSRCLKMCVVGMSTVMVRRELFGKYGLFDESLVCCEDYDLWLRVARKEKFMLLPRPLTLKEGGRDDQLSQIHRLGMDKFRIKSLCSLLDNYSLTPKQTRETVAELSRKCRIYGNGCIKHGRRDEGAFYLDIAQEYQKKFAYILINSDGGEL